MSQYLAKAAEQVAAAAACNEKNFGPGSRYPLLDKYQANALRCAEWYAALAAIEHGQVPASLVRHLLDSVSGAASGGGWS